MSEDLRDRRFKAAKFVISILFFVGLVPIALHMAEYLWPGLSSEKANDLFGLALHPATSAGLILAFLVGACLCVYVGMSFGIITLLPMLLTAFLPLISSKNMKLPAPTGVIVLTLEETCPEGWDVVTDLLGRMPIGFDESVDRPIHSTGGSGEIYIDVLNIPSHEHQYADSRIHAVGNVGNKGRPPGFVFNTYGGVWGHVERREARNTTSNYTGQPLQHLPPYTVVNFCMNTG
jgi:hypothetical protein